MPKIPSWVIAAAKAIFGVSLIGWLIHRGALDLRVVAGAFGHWPLMLTVGLLFCGQSVLIAYRWHTLLHAQTVDLRFKDVVSLTMIGLLFNVVSPGAIGGDLIKSYYVHRHARERRAEAVATIVVDRAIGMIALFVVASVAALPTLLFTTGNQRLRTLALAAVVAAIVGLGGLTLAIRISPDRPSGKHHNPAIRFLLRAFGSLSAYRSCPGTLVRSIAISIIVWLLGCAAFYAAAIAAGAPSFSLGLIFLVPLGFLATALPLSPGGIGVGQVAFAELFRIASEGKYDFGGNAYTVFQAVQILGSLSGIFFYIGWRREMREIPPPTSFPPSLAPGPS